MKLVLLCGGGANQRALAHRLHAAAPIFHIARIGSPPAAPGPPMPFAARWRRRVAVNGIGLPLRLAWSAMLARYARTFPRFPDVPLSDHAGVNAPSVLALIERERPDLVLVSGTDLLRRPLLEAIARHGRAMNLHTGLSPFLKGAPNCTNLALALGEFHLIGNSVMWLGPGIDSGDLIATERTPLTGRESLGQIHWKVMEHGNGLYARCLERWRDGLPLPAVPQSRLGPGRLFLSRDWTPAMISAAVRNHFFRFRPEALAAAGVPLVALEGSVAADAAPAHNSGIPLAQAAPGG